MKTTIRMLCLILPALAACGSVDTSTTGDGGTGGTTSTGGAGGAGGDSTTSTTTGGTGGAPEPACGEPEPAGCAYPDELLTFDPGKLTANIISPIGVWEQNGASRACVGPFADERSFSRVVVGFASEPDATLPIDLRASPTFEPSETVIDYPVRDLETTEPGPAGMTLGIYPVKPVAVAAGEVACITVPLSAHWPIAMYPGACRDGRRAWWLGLPVDPGWTDLNEAPPNKALTWAMLACPLDDTTDDGTPMVNVYERDLAYGVRP